MILLFGKITGIHGIKGEIEISFNDDVYFSHLPSLKPNVDLYISKAYNNYKIIDIKKKKLTIVLKLEGVDCIDATTKLIGHNVYIETKDFDDLDSSTFYTAELCGYSVVFENNIVGSIVDCYITKASTVLDIKLNDNTIVSVPFVLAYFGEASRENRTIELNTIDILQII